MTTTGINELMCKFSGIAAVAAVTLWLFNIQPVTRVVHPGKLRRAIRWYAASALQKALVLKYDHSFSLNFEGDKIDPRESAIIIANHQSVVDYWVCAAIAEKLGVGADVYFYINKKCVHFPTLHTALYSLRGRANWTTPNSLLDKVFEDPLHTPKSRSKWIVVFPEVASWSPEEMRQHQLLCAANGAPLLKHLLYPRFSGFVQAVDFFRDLDINAIYDLTICYSHESQPGIPVKPGITASLVSQHEWCIDVVTKRYKMSGLPTKQKRLIKWLEKLWYRKDQKFEKIFRAKSRRA